MHVCTFGSKRKKKKAAVSLLDTGESPHLKINGYTDLAHFFHTVVEQLPFLC